MPDSRRTIPIGWRPTASASTNTGGLTSTYESFLPSLKYLDGSSI
jgi:hypothetical protein